MDMKIFIGIALKPLIHSSHPGVRKIMHLKGIFSRANGCSPLLLQDAG
jgi:hypothetical protein